MPYRDMEVVPADLSNVLTGILREVLLPILGTRKIRASEANRKQKNKKNKQQQQQPRSRDKAIQRGMKELYQRQRESR